MAKLNGKNWKKLCANAIKKFGRIDSRCYSLFPDLHAVVHDGDVLVGRLLDCQVRRGRQMQPRHHHRPLRHQDRFRGERQTPGKNEISISEKY